MIGKRACLATLIKLTLDDDREAIEATTRIVNGQDAVLDRLGNARWFLARIKDIGDSVKEVSNRRVHSLQFVAFERLTMHRFILILKEQPMLYFCYIMYDMFFVFLPLPNNSASCVSNKKNAGTLHGVF